MADLQQFFQLTQQAQGRLQQLQSELASHLVEARAGGGMVTVTADGRGTIRSIRIDPEALAAGDAEFLSDLVLSAVAEAQRRVGELVQAELKKVPVTPGAAPL